MILKLSILVLFISLVSLSFAYIKLNNKLKEADLALMRLYLSSSINHASELQSTKNTSTSDINIHKENFIKFLSESRDWAFEYIENVQSTLSAFSNNVGPLIDHFDKYGDVLSTQRPDYDSMTKISEEYHKLIKLLPEDK